MDEATFRQRAQALGYHDFAYKDYAPQLDGPLHTHDFSVMLLVVSGSFSLVLEDHTTDYVPGGFCELAAQVRHTERSGAQGARVLLAKKWVAASEGR